MHKILLVEDDKLLSKILSDYLGREGYSVTASYDGIHALHEMSRGIYDLILLDIGLPFLDGFQLLKSFRGEDNTTPIIIISSYSSDSDELETFKSGSNLFHRKPIKPTLLQQQIRSILNYRMVNIREIGEYILDDDDSSLSHMPTGNSIRLTRTEGIFIQLLVRAQNKPISKFELLEKSQTEALLSEPNRVESIVSRLRKKILREFKEDNFIETVYQKGYRINPILYSMPHHQRHLIKRS